MATDDGMKTVNALLGEKEAATQITRISNSCDLSCGPFFLA